MVEVMLEAEEASEPAFTAPRKGHAKVDREAKRFTMEYMHTL